MANIFTNPNHPDISLRTEDTPVRLWRIDGLRQSTHGPRLCDILHNGYDIGLSDYPIWDEGERTALNRKIVERYFLREIGAETTEIFIFYLNRRMREIMPYWNHVFKSLADDLMSNTDLWSTSNAESSSSGESHGDGTTNASASTGNTSVNSTAPQVAISNPPADSYWSTGVFGDGTSEATNTTTDNNSSSSKANGAETSHLAGRQGATVIELLTAFTEYGRPVQMMLDDLSPLFSNIYHGSVE